MVFMVVYHSLNYTKYLPLGFKYFSFLPASFIFITGFLLLQIYKPKLLAGDPGVYKRTVTRGGKLLALFTILNILALPTYIHLLDTLRLSVPEFIVNTFVWGNGRLAKFEILLPIGYLLLVAPLLLWIGCKSRWLVLGLTIVYLFAFWLAEKQLGTWENLQLFTAGILGLAAGIIPFDRVNRAARNLLLTGAAFVAYRVLFYHYGPAMAVQGFGVAATLLFLYSVALRLSAGSRIYKEIVRLGKYSLWAYIFQIAFLQIPAALFGRSHENWSVVFALMAAVMLATWFSVLLLEWFRVRFTWMDRTYRVIFQ